MHANPILEEIYAAREKLLADAGGDVKRYLQGVRQREQASGRLFDPAQHKSKPRAEIDRTSRTIPLPSATAQ
jgi:hypothetical protein